MKRSHALIQFLLVSVLVVAAQTTVTAQMEGPGGVAIQGSTKNYFRFKLAHCGGNQPRVAGVTSIPKTFYKQPAALGGGGWQVTRTPLPRCHYNSTGGLFDLYSRACDNVTPVATAPTRDSTCCRTDGGNTCSLIAEKINGIAIGTTPAAGMFTALQATSMDCTPIGQSAPAAGTSTAVSGNSLIFQNMKVGASGASTHFKIWANTYGTWNSAAAASIMTGSNTETPTQVMGFASDSDLSVYRSRDSVGLYVDNTAPTPLLSTTDTAFTATGITSADFSSIASSVRVGMLIDVPGTPNISGKITAINGTTYTVSGWYLVDGSRRTRTPATGSQAVINPITQAFAVNTISTVTPSSYATGAVGYELDMLLTKTGVGAYSKGLHLVNNAGSTESPFSGIVLEGNWTRGLTINFNGTDSVSNGVEVHKATNNFLAVQTGHRNINYVSQSAASGFQSYGDGIALDIQVPTTYAMLVRDGGAVDQFHVTPTGDVYTKGTLAVGGGSTINKVLRGSATLTYGAIGAQTCEEQSITVPGALQASGSASSSPVASLNASSVLSWSAWIAADGVVNVRVCNVSADSVTPNAVRWNAMVVQ